MSSLNGCNNTVEMEEHCSSDSGKQPTSTTAFIDDNDVTAACNESCVGNVSSNPKVLHRGKLVCLVVAMVIVWALLSLPIVLFHIPVSVVKPVESNRTGNCTDIDITPIEDRIQNFTCHSYDGTLCREILEMIRNCIQDFTPTDQLFIQSDQSETVRPLLNTLNTFGSDDCKAIAVPFLCVYFFGLCDSSGKAYRPSLSQCTNISTGVCTREWAAASNFPDVILPDCTSLQNNVTELEGNVEITTMEPESNQILSCSCREDFYCRNGSNLCYPECGSWKQFSETTSTVSDVFVILSAIIGVLSSVAVLITAGLKRKKIFVFPLVFLVYQTIVYLVMVMFILITFIGRVKLYCRSQDLEESLKAPTPYCTITGIVFYYGLFQLGIWWLFHVIALYWKLQFPLHYRRFEAAGFIHYVHLTAVILGLVFALLPVITPIADHAVKKSNNENFTGGGIGFTMTTVPPIVCTSSDRNVSYYSLAFPLNLILLVGTTLLLLAFWIIHQHHGIFKEKISSSSKRFKIGTAERKISVVVIYYVIMTDISLVSFSLAPRNDSLIIERVGKHFLCELTHPSEPCPRTFEELQYPYLTVISFVLLSLFPFTILIFMINFRELVVKIKKYTSSIQSMMTSSSA